MVGDKTEVAESETAAKQPKAPTPRLFLHYVNAVRPKLMKEFSFGNVHQAPALKKIVLNVGLGEAPKTPKVLDTAV